MALVNFSQDSWNNPDLEVFKAYTRHPDENCFQGESFRELSNRLELDILLVRSYESLMTRVLNETCDGDIHHVLPTCLGGSDTSDNKVRLSVKDHAKAHCLLQAMFVGTSNYRDLAGASRLTNSRV